MPAKAIDQQNDDFCRIRAVSYGLLDNLEKGMIRLGDSQQP
jgi:hypothetical protein